jgi:hypothetical protein
MAVLMSSDRLIGNPILPGIAPVIELTIPLAGPPIV